MPELVEAYNTEGQPTRFLKSDLDLKCPVCLGEVLEDNWPPNYFSYNSNGDSSEYQSSEYQHRIKIVCLHCKNCRQVDFERVIRSNGSVKVTCHYSSPVFLVEMDGKYLTPHDVWRENYKKEHGQYPLEAYA